MFSQACVKNSVHRRVRGIPACLARSHDPPGRHPLARHPLWDTVNERVVCILLECILVRSSFSYLRYNGNVNFVIKGFYSKNDLQWCSTWWSLDPESNAYPTELVWHVLVSLRLLDSHIVMLFWFWVNHLIPCACANANLKIHLHVRVG